MLLLNRILNDVGLLTGKVFKYYIQVPVLGKKSPCSRLEHLQDELYILPLDAANFVNKDALVLSKFLGLVVFHFSSGVIIPVVLVHLVPHKVDESAVSVDSALGMLKVKLLDVEEGLVVGEIV